jgi:hypothetical protein
MAVLLLSTVSCTSSPAEPVSADGTHTVRYGGTVTIAGTRVSFTDITESRCPKDVACVWAGDAAVRLEAGGESVVLHTNPSAGASEGKLAGLTITLVEVKPEPVTSTETKKADYIVTIRTSK